MKTKLLYWLMSAFLLTSCNTDKYDYENLFPEEYNVVFSIKNETNVDLQIPTNETSYTYTITLLKGGAFPEQPGSVSVEAWTEAEIAEYNAKTGSKYYLLPADTYTLSRTDFHFNGNSSRGQDIIVTFDTGKVAQYTANHPDYVTVLPLRLVSNSTIDETKDEIFININIDE